MSARRPHLLALAALLASLALAGGALALQPGARSSNFSPTRPTVAPLPVSPSRATGRDRSSRLGLRTALTVAAVSSLIGTVGLLALGALLVKSRIDERGRRDYATYEVRLSMHDHAERAQVEQMVEAMANIVRAWPLERARRGQPYFALECHYGCRGDGPGEVLFALRCEPPHAGALRAAIQTAYRDVRLGYHPDHPDPLPLAGRLGEPGCVLRLRKDRTFIYPLYDLEDTRSEDPPPLQILARLMSELGRGCSVRVQLTPAHEHVERYARRRFRRHEDRLASSEQRVLRHDAGLRSTLNQQEMRSAAHAQDRAFLWLELQVAADNAQHAKRLTGALTSQRGANRLQRRRMVLREGLYRRRFVRAYPPLLPTLGWGGLHALISTAEAARLLTLPGAEMKDVPVRRLALPRLAAPPEIFRCAERPVAIPEDRE
jgi:hypothetical protein